MYSLQDAESLEENLSSHKLCGIAFIQLLQCTRMWVHLFIWLVNGI